MSAWAVPGFEKDLLDPTVLKKNTKKLPRQDMVQALRSASVAVKVNALQMLEIHGSLDEGEVLAVGVQTRDASASVRSAAAKALGSAADLDLALSSLIGVSSDPDAKVCRAAAEAVGCFGEKVLPLLIKRLSLDPEIADAEILPHIVRFGRLATEPLLRACRDDDERIRTNAVAGLILLGPATLVEHEDEIRGLIQDNSESVREVVRVALNAIHRRMRPAHVEARPEPAEGFVGRALDDKELKKASKEISLEELLRWACDGRAAARVNAWRSLGLRGALEDYSTSLALVALKDEDGRVRVLAAHALVHCPDARLPEVLLGLIKACIKGDRDVRPGIENALKAMLNRSLDPLIGLLDERDQDTAECLVATLVLHGDKGAKVLKKSLEDIRPVVRWNAVSALWKVGGKGLSGAFEEVVGMLSDPFDQARAEAVTALAFMPPKKLNADVALLKRLKEMLEFDASLAVRVAADETLRALGIISE